MLRFQQLKWIKTVMAGALFLSSMTVLADVVDDLIDDAYQNYPGIKSKQMSQSSAGKEVLAAKLNFLPVVTVSAQPATRNYGDVSERNRKAEQRAAHHLEHAVAKRFVQLRDHFFQLVFVLGVLVA